MVKNQSDKKCFWNWGWDPHDFVSTMTYFNQEVNFIFYLIIEILYIK